MLCRELIFLFVVHYIADFMFQTREIAENKSKDFRYLLAHSVMYGFFFLAWGWKFALITGILHGAVDFISSKMSRYVYESCHEYYFYGVLGLDQTIHYICLLEAYRLWAL